MREGAEPVERGVPLSKYAAVMAHLSEGIALEESLAHLGLGAEDWAAAEEGWLERFATGDAELFDAFDEHRRAAQSDVARALSPLDMDARGFCALLRGFTGAQDPLGFLAALGMREGDLFWLIEQWQARMASDEALRKELLALLAEPAGPVPEVRPGKPALRGRRAAPASSLAETSLALVLDLPAMPFTKPAPGAPPPVFAPSPAPAPAASMGETRLAFGPSDRPILPFAKEAEAAPPEEPEVKPAAVAALATTAPAFKVDAPAMPFAKEAAPKPELGTTAPAFKVEVPALPFDKGAPPKEASLGETAPAFRVDKPALPFGDEAAKAKEPAQRTPFGVGLGETAPVFRIDLKALPFAKSAPASPALPEPKLTLEAYATMCAEIWLDPPRAMAIAARYGLTVETKPAEDAAWQGRFAGNQALKTAWERLAIEAGQRIRGGK
ncbi:hypothetical protein [Polyangium aurulentum]|uniref:hypothetical protein n=1 Tax=Polyangium aurulentum TaxID=2567896 RepID=UPI0010AEE229|nr:hypothetical protein [Polyangium aurulentum]UQA58489.1 hypothetical protein E8A73_045810 [Polyangium aurulentum]